MKKLLALLVVLCACNFSYAQNNITLDLRDTPVRSALEMVFKDAGIKNYVIDNDVSGIIGRIEVTGQSVESALKLIIRANSDLLTYVVENDVYIVKKRKITPTSLPVIPDIAIDSPKANSFEVIHLNFIDPFDLQSIFGPILLFSQFGRYTGGMNGMGASGNGGFGGAGGFGNGAMGGNGGLGLGAGNGMGGGAMGGIGGGAFGGMNGGVGGFGGGRNF